MDKNNSLDRGGVSLYRQVAGLLRRKLEQGAWKMGDQLPVLEVLMAEYGVSRVTMRQAVALLEQDGLVKRGQGRGTFVTGDATTERWLMIPTEWRALIQHIVGLSGHFVTLEDGQGVPELLSAEGLPAAHYWHTRRVNYADGVPYSLTCIYLDERIRRKAPAAYLSQAVLPLLAKHLGKSLGRATQMLEVATADIETARLLNLAVGTPIVQVRRVVSDTKACVVYCAEVSYPANRLRIQTTLFPATFKDPETPK